MNKTDLLTRTRAELLKLAQRLGLRGVTALKKAALASKIHRAQKKKSGVAAVAHRVAAAVKRRALRKRTHKPVLRSKPIQRRSAAPKSTPKTMPAQSQANGTAEISAHKFDVAPVAQAPVQMFREEYLGELPEVYGTGRLFLTARDPHWLYAYWDLTSQQMADYRGQSSDGRLLLRIHEKNHREPVQELALQHDSRNWYIPANKAAATYTAVLGFWRRDGSFHVVSRSREATTPSDHISADTTARFVTIPLDVSFHELFRIIRGHMKDGESLAEALHRLQAAGFRFPFKLGLELGPWSAEQAEELERLLGGDILRRLRMGSFEISEWLRRRLQEQLGSAMFSAFSPAGASWSAAPGKGFWFGINAELIVHGATEPTAKVTIDGKPVALQSDGTFSFHYAFPDGQYRLPVVAVSAAGDDRRAVQLTFERRTATTSDVRRVKGSKQLKSPVVV